MKTASTPDIGVRFEFLRWAIAGGFGLPGTSQKGMIDLLVLHTRGAVAPNMWGRWESGTQIEGKSAQLIEELARAAAVDASFSWIVTGKPPAPALFATWLGGRSRQAPVRHAPTRETVEPEAQDITHRPRRPKRSG